jgi:hypothetical protein
VHHFVAHEPAWLRASPEGPAPPLLTSLGMCDTIVAITPEGLLFAKNSDAGMEELAT